MPRAGRPRPWRRQGRTVLLPDPRLDSLINTIAGLTSQVSQLANQVEEIRKKEQG